MTPQRRKNVAVVVASCLLAALGLFNLASKATFEMLDDGVLWQDSPQGVIASRIAPGSPGDQAGVVVGDILLGIDAAEVLSTNDAERILEKGRSGDRLGYAVLRASQRLVVELEVEPLPQGNVSLFYYLSLVGFFSLAVGTVVVLRRPPNRTTLHFYAICVLFFLVYSTSSTGRLDAPDWLLFWTDHLATLFLPVTFLHFSLTFQQRRLSGRTFLTALLYALPSGVAIFTMVGQGLLATGRGSPWLWTVGTAVDHWKPMYFSLVFILSFIVLRESYRRTESLVIRRQMKWLVWGTGAGVLPFFLFYAVPFSLGREPRLAMELLGYVPLALIPLALAYAVVRHRLMDVELIFRRSIGFVLASAFLLGVSLLVVGVMKTLLARSDAPRTTAIAVITSLVVVLLLSPLKRLVQDWSERVFYRERFASRKILLRLSHELNAELEPARVAERLLDGVESAYGLAAGAVLVPDADGGFSALRARGRLGPANEPVRLPVDGVVLQRLRRGNPVHPETESEAPPDAARLNIAHYFPCIWRDELIAVLAVGRREGLDLLNSEERDGLESLAAHAAGAFSNARLYASLAQKANDLQALTDYNANILESMGTGIVVLDLEGRIVRWNRAMERLSALRGAYATGRRLEDVFPEAFLDPIRNTLATGDPDGIAHVYKLHLPSGDGQGSMVNVSIAPFRESGGARGGTLLLLEDVTARVRLEEQLLHSEKMASIGLLAAGVAHEVNTPLAGISSYTQMLRNQVGPEDPRSGLLEKIEKQTFRAARIVQNLLNFSRAGSPEMVPLDINRVILDVLSLVEHQLDGAKIRVRKELAEDLPAVRGSESRLQQVFFNLVLNAKDAMPSGGWLTLRTYADGDTFVAEIADTGQGIRREDLKRIYDPFFTTKGVGRGTGLGLAVSYGILQEHGGAVFVESTPGQGTTFQVALPALRTQEVAHR